MLRIVTVFLSANLKSAQELMLFTKKVTTFPEVYMMNICKKLPESGG